MPRRSARPGGKTIMAACGQLKSATERVRKSRTEAAGRPRPRLTCRRSSTQSRLMFRPTCCRTDLWIKSRDMGSKKEAPQ